MNVIDKVQEKQGKCADLAFEMSRLHPKYEVVRLPIVLGAIGLEPPKLFTDWESTRVCYQEYSPSDNLGNAEGCSVGESSHSPKSSGRV